MYHKSNTVVKWCVNQRAAGSSNEQESFRNIQMNARDLKSTVADWGLLLTRTPGMVLMSDEDLFLKSAVKLSFGNDKAAKDNYDCLVQLAEPTAPINAQHNNATAAK